MIEVVEIKDNMPTDLEPLSDKAIEMIKGLGGYFNLLNTPTENVFSNQIYSNVSFSNGYNVGVSKFALKGDDLLDSDYKKYWNVYLEDEKHRELSHLPDLKYCLEDMDENELLACLTEISQLEPLKDNKSLKMINELLYIEKYGSEKQDIEVNVQVDDIHSYTFTLNDIKSIDFKRVNRQ